MREENHEGERGPARKLYSLTEKGRGEFSRWLADDPEKALILRDPFLMRFIFFGFGDRERSLAMIEDQIEVWENMLETRQENMGRWQSHDVHVRLMAELGVGLNRAFLEWLRRAREEITLADAEALTAIPSAEIAG